MPKKEGRDTAEALFFFDQLFDSVINGHSLKAETDLRSVIKGICDKFQLTGSLQGRDVTRMRAIFDEQLTHETHVLALIHGAQTTSIRELSACCGISKSEVHNILKKHDLKPYKPMKVHKLFERDFDPRLQFAQWVMEKLTEDSEFIKQMLITDECIFTTNGQICQQNSFWKKEVNQQYRSSILTCPLSIGAACGFNMM